MSAKIVAIGVGPYVSLKELQVMADGHYVLVDDFNKLAKSITDVMDLVCQWKWKQRIKVWTDT